MIMILKFIATILLLHSISLLVVILLDNYW